MEEKEDVGRGTGCGKGGYGMWEGGVPDVGVSVRTRVTDRVSSAAVKEGFFENSNHCTEEKQELVERICAHLGEVIPEQSRIAQIRNVLLIHPGITQEALDSGLIRGVLTQFTVDVENESNSAVWSPGLLQFRLDEATGVDYDAIAARTAEMQKQDAEPASPKEVVKRFPDEM